VGLQCGITGLPNVGKSTIFNALTAASAQASNYPFCTIEPNVGQVHIHDDRLSEIMKHIKSKKIVPASIEFVDIAGLVKGAHKGEGLGNQFLANILDMDTLVHVARSFTAPDVAHVEPDIDPVRDIEIVETEILLKDIELVIRRQSRDKKIAKSGDGYAIKETHVLDRVLEMLNNGSQLRFAQLHEEEKSVVEEMKLLSYKPVIYVLNISEGEIGKESDIIKKFKEFAESKQTPVVLISGKIEEELMRLPQDERQAFSSDYGITEFGLDSIIKQTFKSLNLITFFTANENEIHAWTIPAGTKAPQAAGKIHSDFERGFIRAEAISFDDYVKYNGEHGCKEHGTMRLEGKDYVVRDGDIIFFRFNV